MKEVKLPAPAQSPTQGRRYLSSTPAILRPLLRRAVSMLLLLLLMAFVWEGLKWIGGDPWRPGFSTVTAG